MNKITPFFLFYAFCVISLCYSCDNEEFAPAHEDFNTFVQQQPIEEVESMLYSVDPQVLYTETRQEDDFICTVDVMAASAENQDFLLDHFDDMYVGGLYRYESLFDGGFSPVTGGQLAPQEFGIAGLPVDRVSYQIPQPGIVSYLQSINDLRQQTSYALADAQIDFRVIDVYSMDQLAMKLGAELKIGLWGKISSSVETNRLEELSYFIIEMKQKHFSVNLELPRQPSDFFKALPNTGELGSWSPVICSSITYGRAAYFIVSSSQNRETAKLAIDATFKAFSSNLQVDVNDEHEAVANEFSIDGLIYGGDQNLALQSISGIEAIREYITSGFSEENAFGVPLAFKFRFLRDLSVAKTVSSVEYPIRNHCESIPELRDVTISRDSEILTSIGKNIPIHDRGDREFGGQGPNVWSNLTLLISDDSTRLDLEILAVFQELGADEGDQERDTKGVVSLRKTIYNAPPGFIIDTIYTPTTASYHYLDDDTSIDISPTFIDSLVYQYSIMGDTEGLDLPEFDDPGSPEHHSFWSASFNDLRLRIKNQ